MCLVSIWHRFHSTDSIKADRTNIAYIIIENNRIVCIIQNILQPINFKMWTHFLTDFLNIFPETCMGGFHGTGENCCYYKLLKTFVWIKLYLLFYLNWIPDQILCNFRIIPVCLRIISVSLCHQLVNLILVDTKCLNHSL